jgi:phenylalanine-4-hydroxylase
MGTVYCEVHEVPIETVPVPRYTDVEHGTWELLLAKQHSLIEGRACQPFIDGVRAIDFPQKRIPTLAEVSERIQKHTGWKLIRVDGLVRSPEFFGLLSRKIFPSTDFIRKREDLDYTPAPDMFHDLFGHAPLLTNPDFTEFFEAFGHVGAAAYRKHPDPDHEMHKMLSRIYWFTVEFGLINTPAGLRAYGSGSCSSPQELQFCVSKECRHHPFDIELISKRDYDIWHLQEDVFVIDSFTQLGGEFRRFAREQGLL